MASRLANAAPCAALVVLVTTRAAVGAEPAMPQPSQTIRGAATEQTARNSEWRSDILRNRVELLTDAVTAADERATFLLQALAINAGFQLGFAIFACWCAGRRARLP